MLYTCNRRCLDVWIFIVCVGCSYFSMLCHFLPLQEKQARIASLYLPLYGLILDNMPRFFLRDLFPIYFTSSDQVSLSASSFQLPAPLFDRLCKIGFSPCFLLNSVLCVSLCSMNLSMIHIWFSSPTLWFPCLCELVLLINQTTS